MEVIRFGSFESLVIDDEHQAYVFVRRLNGKSLYACFNASDKEVKVSIPLQSDELGMWSNVLDNHSDVALESNFLRVNLLAHGFAWYVKDSI